MTKTFLESAAGTVQRDPQSLLHGVVEILNDAVGAANASNDLLEFENGLDGVIGGNYTIAVQADTTLLGAGRIRWRRDGQVHEMALQTAITLADDGDITAAKYRAFRIEISDLGAVTAVAIGASNLDNGEDAMLSMASLAQTASTVEICYVTITKSDGAFNILTTNTNAANVTVAVYYLKTPRQRAAGLSADMGAAIAIGSSDDEFSHGTIDVTTQGVKVAQIAAAATVAFDDNDTIGEDQFGGHLIVVGLDGASVYALASDGLAGAVSAMAHTTAALRNTALDTIQAQIPAIFPVLGRVLCANAKAGTFTYNTDDGAGTDGTFTFVSETYAAFDRLDQAGTGQGVDQPAFSPAAADIEDIVLKLLGGV